MNQFPKYIFFLLFAFISFSASSQLSIPAGTTFKYLKSKDAVGIPYYWIGDTYDDSSWESSPAPFRYGDGTGGTLLSDMQNNYSGIYMRATFDVLNADLIEELNFSVNYDDGFIIYINGYKVLDINAPYSPTPTSFALANHESGIFEAFRTILDPGILKEGQNIIAVQGFNISLESSDFYFDMEMNANKTIPEYPDSLGITLSHPSGFYTSPFDITISYPDPTVKIYYTLDGSNPQESSSGSEITSGSSININPTSTVLRPRTPAVTLRLSVSKEGFRGSKPIARTYIFLESVKTQTYPGGDWPADNVNGQAIDLEMDSRIVNHASYKNQIENAFKQIPSISIITDIKNLFDPNTGIYVNAMEHGELWEKECSAELIFPDGAEGFSVNAGLRIRGGWSRHDEFAKHAFRLLFKEQYGNAKLYFPLFEDEGVKRFDNIDLRTAQNYAWSNGSSNNTMIREVFSRDSQRDMNQPYTRSRYYHLYLNGMYWGIFQTQERSEASFASDYFGGEEEEYDVIKVATDLGYVIEATDGNLEGWKKIYDLSVSGFISNLSYFLLMGSDHTGEKIPGAETLVEMDNLIDYMLTIFYTGNFDAPVSSFSNNYNPNNFYCINNREYKPEGFRFFNHDAEHSLFAEAHGPGVGLYENRVNLGTLTTDKKMDVSSFEKFQPQWLHHRLTANAEYRQRFIDRAWLHFSEGGSLSPAKNLERFNARADQFDTAIIAESARWGDGRDWVSSPYTKNDHWIPELNKVRNNFFPVRTSIVENQLINAGLYTSINPPVFSVNSKVIGGEKYNFSDYILLTINNTESSSIVYYTKDGSDPRLIGGRINSKASAMDSDEIIELVNTTQIVKARTYQDGEWSALKFMNFLKINEDYSNLKITEMYFHPPDKIEGIDTINGKNFEFIEFKNIGEWAIDLSGLVLDSAVYYEFPNNTILQSGEFYVVVSKPTTFYNETLLEASGNYEGFLANEGDEILLKDKNDNAIIHFSFAIEYPWPESASNTGYSLVSSDRNPTEDPANGWYWITSLNKGGSPFKNEPYPNNMASNIVEEAEVLLYPNPGNEFLKIQLNNTSPEFTMEIGLYSLSGNLIYAKSTGNETTIYPNSFNLNPGVYILKIRSDNFSRSFRYIWY